MSVNWDEAKNKYVFGNRTYQQIADEFGVTRQAVSDGIRKSEKALHKYEEKLGLVQRWKNEMGISSLGA